VAIPNFWYNISTDLPIPLPPPIDPVDEGGSRISLLNKILPSELIHQEFSGERFILIPERIRDFYRRIGRPTPLRRAYGFEKAIGAKVKIYYKFEGFLPSGSHKLNTALPQVYYAIKDGVKEVVTETGAG
jgi:tryptophan synthase beta chain